MARTLEWKLWLQATLALRLPQGLISKGRASR
jgi:hypothetical protein